MKRTLTPLSLGLALGLTLTACGGYVDKYEEGVAEYEPTYCYAALGGGIECFREPNHADERRLVNYFGDHPSRFDRPEAPEAVNPVAPPMVKTWVKDPEPVVRPMPKGDVADRPWLGPGYAEPVAHRASPQATRAFLRQAHEHLGQSIQQGSQERLRNLNQQESEGEGAADDPPIDAPPFR